MRARWIVIPLVALLSANLLSFATDGPLTAWAMARGKTDENGYVLAYGGTLGSTPGPLTIFPNLRVRTNENGYLMVALAGGTATMDAVIGSGGQRLDLSTADVTTLARGANPQTVKVYNTTDGTNTEFMQFSWGSNLARIGTNKAGTGAGRDMGIGPFGNGNLDFYINNAQSWRISSTNNLLPLVTTNTADLGAASNAIRTGYFGTSVVTPIVRASGTAPTCSSNCGTSPSVAGADSAGIVTMGATGSPASGWVLTFNGTWAAAPSCTVQSALTGMAAGKAPIVVATTTTTLTVTTNGTAPANSDKYAYTCIGVQ